MSAKLKLRGRMTGPRAIDLFPVDLCQHARRWDGHNVRVLISWHGLPVIDLIFVSLLGLGVRTYAPFFLACAISPDCQSARTPARRSRLARHDFHLDVTCPKRCLYAALWQRTIQ